MLHSNPLGAESIHNCADPTTALPRLIRQVLVLTGNITQSLKATNLTQAKSIIAVTDDPILNLELALMAKEAAQHPQFLSVLRFYDQYFSENLPLLLLQSKAFSLHALSAEAFAGAAFGENIISLFRLQNQTILVTEYRIEPGDTLIGKLIAETSYGYGVLPILLDTRNLQKGIESMGHNHPTPLSTT